MATYKANSTLGYVIVGNAYTLGSPNDTYGVTRGFFRFDTSTITAPLADITAVDLIMNCELISINNADIYLKSAITSDANWGTTIVAGVADFASTTAHLEDSVAVSSTGTKTFSVDKNNLDLSGTTWFRLSNGWEYTTTQSAIRFSSANNATASLRPVLRVTSSDGVTYIPAISIIFT